MMIKKYRSWKTSYYSRITYSTNERKPFFEIAQRFLPEDQHAIIVDIGSGKGEFGECGNITAKYDNLYFLDGNETTVLQLKKNGVRNVILYTAPERLPFDDATVSYIHCSHLIEHLFPKELYALMREIDRVLKNSGILAISAPLFWKQFYFDLSHIRPYYPETLMRYLTFESSNYSAAKLSQKYRLMELIYRYDALVPYEEGLGSEYFFLDLIIQSIKKILSFLKVRYYLKNAFTLILRKNSLS